MKNKIYLLVLFLMSYSYSSFSQDYRVIEKSASDYFLSLAGKSNDAPSLFDTLEKNLHQPAGSSDAVINPASYDSLLAAFDSYKAELGNVSTDSAEVLFNSWYLMMSNAFYDYNKEKFFTSGTKKVILFSASMSCYCTLEMCRKQTIEIMKFAGEKKMDYWIIDSYEHNDLQLKYETLFAPSVLLLDGSNNMLAKIEYEEEMISKLNNYYTQREKQ